MTEIKQASFRLGEDSIEKFKVLASELDCNQAEMFNSLISNFELARAKGQIVDRGKEIETFQNTSNTLVNMFVNSLAINQTAEATLREKLSDEINSKDTTIKDLQEQKSNLSSEALTAKESVEVFERQNKDIGKELDNLKTEFLQKTNTISSQLEQISTLNSIVGEYKLYKNINLEVEAKNKNLLLESLELKHKGVDLEGKIKNLEQMIEFFKDEIPTLKQEKIQLSKQLQQIEISYKEEIRVEKKSFEIKINDELNKTKKEFETKLELAKEKAQIEKEKLIAQNDRLEEKYKDTITKIEEIKSKTNKQTKPKDEVK